MLTNSILSVYRLYCRQDGKRPVVCPTNLRNARKATATPPAGTEWELYRKGLFSGRWRMVDYGVTPTLNIK